MTKLSLRELKNSYNELVEKLQGLKESLEVLIETPFNLNAKLAIKEQANYLYFNPDMEICEELEVFECSLLEEILTDVFGKETVASWGSSIYDLSTVPDIPVYPHKALRPLGCLKLYALERSNLEPVLEKLKTMQKTEISGKECELGLEDTALLIEYHSKKKQIALEILDHLKEKVCLKEAEKTIAHLKAISLREGYSEVDNTAYLTAVEALEKSLN